MTSIPTASRPIAPFVARVLKTVGVIITLAVLLDFFVLPLPYKPLERQWQLAFTTQIVDRGIVPLVGLGLLFAGYWIDSVAGLGSGDRKTWWQDLRLWAALLASLLGLLYVLAFPLHLNNVRLNQASIVEQVNKEADEAKGKLDQNLANALQQQRAQFTQLLNASDAELDQAVQANRITSEQANQIKQFKQNPESIGPFLEERVQQLRTRGQSEILDRQTNALATARLESTKSVLRTGIGSLLLAIGYIIVGWSALKVLD